MTSCHTDILCTAASYSIEVLVLLKAPRFFRMHPHLTPPEGTPEAVVLEALSPPHFQDMACHGSASRVIKNVKLRDTVLYSVHLATHMLTAANIARVFCMLIGTTLLSARTRAFRRRLAGGEAASKRRASARSCRVRWAPYSNEADRDYGDFVVVDCTHGSALTLTHHKGHNNLPDLPPSDSSTGLVLNALKANQSAAWHDEQAAFDKSLVSCNHFDEDGILSAWSWINKDQALQHEAGVSPCRHDASAVTCMIAGAILFASLMVINQRHCAKIRIAPMQASLDFVLKRQMFCSAARRRSGWRFPRAAAATLPHRQLATSRSFARWCSRQCASCASRPQAGLLAGAARSGSLFCTVSVQGCRCQSLHNRRNAAFAAHAGPETTSQLVDPYVTQPFLCRC